MTIDAVFDMTGKDRFADASCRSATVILNAICRYDPLCTRVETDAPYPKSFHAGPEYASGFIDHQKSSGSNSIEPAHSKYSQIDRSADESIILVNYNSQAFQKSFFACDIYNDCNPSLQNPKRWDQMAWL